MKKKLQLLIFSFIMIISSWNRMDAQTNGWQPIYLTAGGGNIMFGLEASFRTGPCNDSDVIYVKFVNHNAYPVKLEWSDGVFTQELIWINKDQVSDKKSLTVPANSKMEGNCLNSTFPELIIKVKNFVPDLRAFKRYSTYNLDVTAVQ